MPTPDRPHVTVSLNVEGFSGDASGTHEVDRGEWDAMTPAERVALLDQSAADHAANYVGWGWHITDPADAAAATVDADPVRVPATGAELLAELRAEFAEADADGASSNDIAQLLDDFITARGLLTVLYAVRGNAK